MTNPAASRRWNVTAELALFGDTLDEAETMLEDVVAWVDFAGGSITVAADDLERVETPAKASDRVGQA